MTAAEMRDMCRHMRVAHTLATAIGGVQDAAAGQRKGCSLMKRSTGRRGTYLDWPLKRAGTGLPQIHSAAVSSARGLPLAACPMPTQHVVVVRPAHGCRRRQAPSCERLAAPRCAPSPHSQLRRGEWPSKRTQPLSTAAASSLHKQQGLVQRQERLLQRSCIAHRLRATVNQQLARP
jgi:hypothetical protein